MKEVNLNSIFVQMHLLLAEQKIACVLYLLFFSRLFQSNIPHLLCKDLKVCKIDQNLIIHGLMHTKAQHMCVYICNALVSMKVSEYLCFVHMVNNKYCIMLPNRDVNAFLFNIIIKSYTLSNVIIAFLLDSHWFNDSISNIKIFVAIFNLQTFAIFNFTHICLHMQSA